MWTWQPTSVGRATSRWVPPRRSSPPRKGSQAGYFADGQTPRPLLARAIGCINAKVEATVNAIKERGLARAT